MLYTRGIEVYRYILRKLVRVDKSLEVASRYSSANKMLLEVVILITRLDNILAFYNYTIRYLLISNYYLDKLRLY